MIKKIGIFYGSTRGKTEYIAAILKNKLKDNPEIFDVSNGIEKIKDFDILIFLAPTYGAGQLQEDWMRVMDDLKNTDFSNKKVGLIGRGNQGFFAATFIDAIRDLYDIIIENNGEVIGSTSLEGYSFEKSKSVINNKFIGLALDEMFMMDEINEKLDNWIKNLGN
ncbi:flavodoxin [Cetobacterium sp. 2A]|uniref:flavodoxin n=1 Tax=Cetobacterium sp. 2A TaxID=2754723 RepID=UPI00163C23B2|nr:flavodoxin [Cetobacterium sp. 2A]MBC2856786.1 flavodoxin [Cetobacterium sp. 2A]